jgi:thioredoxin 1
MVEVKKFYAEWCGPCKVLTPLMENVKTKFTSVKFENVDIDSQFEIAQKYFVRSVPTVIIEKNGKEVERFVGVQSELGILDFFSYIYIVNKNNTIYGWN